MKLIPATLGLAFAVSLQTASFAKGDAARGGSIAQKNCAPCHAIRRSGESPNPKSPPFRQLGQRYKVENLEEALAEGIVIGHEGAEMPVFELAPPQIEDLIEYLRQIQTRAE